MTDKRTEAVYLCQRAPFFKIKLASGEVQAKDGVLALTAEQNDELVHLMEDRPDIRGVLRKVNAETAEAVSQKFRKGKGPAAVQGPYASDNRVPDAAKAAALAQSREALTGSQNPINKGASQPGPNKPEIKENTGNTMETEQVVQELKVPASPSGSVLDRLKAKDQVDPA